MTKEYKNLEDLIAAKKEYENLLGNLDESKRILMSESDPDLKEMAREEMTECEEKNPPV